MANDINEEKDLANKLKTAVKFEKEINSPLTEEDKAHINDITFNLKNTLQKNKSVKKKSTFFSNFSFTFLNFQVLGSATASLVIGFFVGQQFLTETIIPQNNQFLEKSLNNVDDAQLVSFLDKIEPGKKVSIDLNENIQIILDVSSEPVENSKNCHEVNFQILGLTKAQNIKMIACKNENQEDKTWQLKDLQ